MRTPARVAQKSPTRKDSRGSKGRGKAPLKAELALAMADALTDILRYEEQRRRRL